MNTVAVEIDPDLIDLMLETCRSRREVAVNRRNAADAEIESLDHQIERLEEAGAHHVARKPVRIRLVKMVNGRVKRGQSEKLIRGLLKQRNGSGVTVQEIIKATGTKRGTVHRLLRVWKDRGDVRQGDDSQWHWMK